MAVENLGINQQLFEYLVQSINETPFYRLLGITISKIGPGEAELTVASNVKHTNPIGLIHGGLIMSLADAAMGNAIRSLGIKGVTVDQSSSFLAASKIDAMIIARGKVIKTGRNMIFAQASLLSENKVLSICKGTFFKTGDIIL